MPPKKGKKKPVSNRGFATVSVPKKKTEEDEAAESAALAAVEAATVPAVESADAVTGQGIDSANAGDGPSADAAPGKEGEWDAEASERSDLQALAEKIKPAVEREVSRTMKVSARHYRAGRPSWLISYTFARSSITSDGCPRACRPTRGTRAIW